MRLAGLKVLKRLVISLLFLTALAAPANASALGLQIVNQSTYQPDEVWINVYGDEFDVPGMSNNVPKTLSEMGGELTINKLISGRVYVSYGSPVNALALPFSSGPRFDWAELTVTPVPEDKANLTAVDQFAIGMRMETLNGSGEVQETLGEANSDTMFAALQQIPGGAQATVRDSSGILRILSPLQTNAYPDLGEYVRSMAGQTITLHTAYYGSPFTVTEYSGTFAPDGSIPLHGTTNPSGMAPGTISIEGNRLIEDIYTGNETPNNVEGAIRRDLLAGFSTGLWGGKYGNDALSFCTNPLLKPEGWICPDGFNQPAFGDARASLSPFPTCEQYAAVINQYSDSYGNPYSDASKNTTVSLDQSNVAKLRLTILADSGNAQPVHSGNPNCGAAAPAPLASGGAAAASTAGRVKLLKLLKLFKKAQVKGARTQVGWVVCAGGCGRVKLLAKKGRKVLGRSGAVVKGGKAALTLRLTKSGQRLLARKRRLKATVTVWVTPPGGQTTRLQQTVLLIEKARKHRRR